jgi:hypothetical protein
MYVHPALVRGRLLRGRFAEFENFYLLVQGTAPNTSRPIHPFDVTNPTRHDRARAQFHQDETNTALGRLSCDGMRRPCGQD